MEQTESPAGFSTFEAYLNTLPAQMQVNIHDSMKRDESYSWKLWQAAQAAERERVTLLLAAVREHWIKANGPDSLSVRALDVIAEVIADGSYVESGPNVLYAQVQALDGEPIASADPKPRWFDLKA